MLVCGTTFEQVHCGRWGIDRIKKLPKNRQKWKYLSNKFFFQGEASLVAQFFRFFYFFFQKICGNEHCNWFKFKCAGFFDAAGVWIFPKISEKFHALQQKIGYMKTAEILQVVEIWAILYVCKKSRRLVLFYEKNRVFYGPYAALVQNNHFKRLITSAWGQFRTGNFACSIFLKWQWTL